MILRYTGTDGSASNQRLSVITGGLVEAFVINNAGSVGIGTTAPGAKLDVKDTNNFQVTPNQSAAGEFPTSVLINSAGAGLTLLPDGNGAVGPKLFLGYRDTATPMWRSALEIANTSGYGNLLLMKSGGNVGIGTATPNSSYKVDVNGNLNASGTITGGTIHAKYQDVASGFNPHRNLRLAPSLFSTTQNPTRLLLQRKPTTLALPALFRYSPALRSARVALARCWWLLPDE
jgi:hypothetical protein